MAKKEIVIIELSLALHFVCPFMESSALKQKRRTAIKSVNCLPQTPYSESL